MQGPLLGLAEQTRRRSTKRVAITLISLLTLALSVSAFADTYNFYFAKPKKGQSAPQASAEDEESSPEEEAPKKVETAKPAETAISGGTAPIVIHNNNSIGYPYAPNAPVAPPVIAPPTPVAPLSPTLTGSTTTGPVLTETALAPQAPSKSYWKMALTGTLVSANVVQTDLNYGVLTEYSYRGKSYGGLVTLGYAMNRDFSLNLYGGANYVDYYSTARLLAGLDLDIVPFHLAIGSLDLFDFGFIVGMSTMKASEDNLATLHAGARLNVNFGDFGLTGAVRANLGYAMIEAGITTRL